MAGSSGYQVRFTRLGLTLLHTAEIAILVGQGMRPKDDFIDALEQAEKEIDDIRHYTPGYLKRAARRKADAVTFKRVPPGEAPTRTPAPRGPAGAWEIMRARRRR
jgi:hypothetical protein